MSAQWKKGRIILALGGMRKGERKEVLGVIYNDAIGVHRGGPVDLSKGWGVTHLKSGLSMNAGLSFRTSAEAKRWAREIYSLKPSEWRKDMPNVAKLKTGVRQLKQMLGLST